MQSRPAAPSSVPSKLTITTKMKETDEQNANITAEMSRASLRFDTFTIFDLMFSLKYRVRSAAWEAKGVSVELAWSGARSQQQSINLILSKVYCDHHGNMDICDTRQYSY